MNKQELARVHEAMCYQIIERGQHCTWDHARYEPTPVPPGLKRKLHKLADNLGYQVIEAAGLPEGLLGATSTPELHTITLRFELADAPHCRILSHELGHAILHSTIGQNRSDGHDGQLEEMVVEGSAGLVMAEFKASDGRFTLEYLQNACKNPVLWTKPAKEWLAMTRTDAVTMANMIISEVR